MERWLSLAVLGACSFAPGRFAGTDAGGGGDDTMLDGAPGDAPTDVAADATPDTPPSPLRVHSIDVVDAMVAGGPHTDFPMLVSLTETWLRSTTNGGDVANDSGVDIYFSADQAGTTRLAHEVEVYAATSGVLVAWVKIPSLSNDTVIYLHYGDPAITTSQEMVNETWSGGYSLVVHMDGTGDASGTSSNVNTQNVGAVAAGRFGSAGSFNGMDSSSDHGSAADNIFGGGGTVEAWFFANTFGEGSRGRIVDKNDPTGWALFVDNQNVDNSFSFTHDATGAQTLGAWAGPDDSVSTGAWHHLAVTYNKGAVGNDPTAVLDGAVVTLSQPFTPTGSMVNDGDANVVIGSDPDDTRAFNGNLDEVRLSTTARSTSWLVTQYRNMNDPAGFYMVSAPL